MTVETPERERIQVTLHFRLLIRRSPLSFFFSLSHRNFLAFKVRLRQLSTIKQSGVKKSGESNFHDQCSRVSANVSEPSKLGYLDLAFHSRRRHSPPSLPFVADFRV